jgi:hypothetical protein
VKPEEYVELPVDERELPRFARRILKRARRDNQTGLLAYALIPGGSNPPPWIWRLVFVREGSRTLFSAGPGLRRGRKWIDLTPGVHRLTFAVGGMGEVEFTRDFRVDAGSILVAGCRTTYARLPGSKNRRPNRWHLGVLPPESESGPAQAETPPKGPGQPS